LEIQDFLNDPPGSTIGKPTLEPPSSTRAPGIGLGVGVLADALPSQPVANAVGVGIAVGVPHVGNGTGTGTGVSRGAGVAVGVPAGQRVAIGGPNRPGVAVGVPTHDLLQLGDDSGPGAAETSLPTQDPPTNQQHHQFRPGMLLPPGAEMGIPAAVPPSPANAVVGVGQLVDFPATTSRQNAALWSETNGALTEDEALERALRESIQN